MKKATIFSPWHFRAFYFFACKKDEEKLKTDDKQ
jgi:hypothetical protein